jgi:hypothetical protein
MDESNEDFSEKFDAAELGEPQISIPNELPVLPLCATL